MLTERQTAVLTLRYVEGVPTDSLVAERLGIQRPAVTKCRRRALERLRSVNQTGERQEICEQIAAELQKWNQKRTLYIEGKI